MKMHPFQKVALFCVLSLIALIFIGAVVRVTGAGMGCPDWPKCWGAYAPPSSMEGVDVDALVDHPDFQRKYKRLHGEDAVLTKDALREMFNPRHAWTEYLNRLSAMPITFGSLALVTSALIYYRKKRRSIVLLAYSALALVLLNAIVGMIVVKTGLSEGVITLHMALSMLLLCVLVYLTWAGGEQKKVVQFKSHQSTCWKVGLVLFILILIEGIMGSQVRELTDALAKQNPDAVRADWVADLEQSAVYLVHRSFSWVLVLITFYYLYINSKYKLNGLKWSEFGVGLIVLSQMVLGLVLSNIGILPVAQVLHIGLSSILIAILFYWLLCARKKSS